MLEVIITVANLITALINAATAYHLYKLATEAKGDK